MYPNSSISLAKVLQQPKGVEKAVLNYLRAHGVDVSDKANKTIAPIVRYHDIDVETLTSVKFFDGSGTLANTNMKGFLPAKDEHMIITHIRILEGLNASIPATAWTEGLSTADLKNGTVDIKSNGSVIIPELPLTVFTEADEHPAAGFYALAIPIIWEADNAFTFEVTFPVAPAGTAQNMRVELHGIGLNS